MNRIYLFEIIDNDSNHERNLMLYQEKDSLMTPLIKDFQIGLPIFPSFDDIVTYLHKKANNTVISYSPNDLDTVCSHPYEIQDFTDYELENGACFHRFYHLDFWPTQEQEKTLQENKINIYRLNQKEISALERTLQHHQ